MADKPKRASEYRSEQFELVRATCLYVATKLGDMTDDLVIVGGLVPSLIVDQTALPEDVAAHVGTMDLDVGLQLALLDEGRYRKLTERLRDAGFTMDKNEDGKLSLRSQQARAGELRLLLSLSAYISEPTSPVDRPPIELMRPPASYQSGVRPASSRIDRPSKCRMGFEERQGFFMGFAVHPGRCRASTGSRWAGRPGAP